MRVHFCGVRGSTPAPGAPFVRYGGHTSCLAIAAGDEVVPTLLLDAGTGIRQVTQLLGGAPFLGTILLTHLHWDHFQGLPFFSGGDQEGSHVRLLLPDQEDGSDAEAVLARGMSPPQFPIRPSQLRGQWSFDTLLPGHLDLRPIPPPGRGLGCRREGGFSVEVREIPHKGGKTFGYRVDDGTAIVAYVPDHCPTALGAGPDGLGEYHRSVLELAIGADVLVHDAHLFAEELATDATFGHAAAEYAVELGRRAGVGTVVLFHHRPDRGDDALEQLADRFRESGVAVTVAAEGMVLEL